MFRISRRQVKHVDSRKGRVTATSRDTNGVLWLPDREASDPPPNLQFNARCTSAGGLMQVGGPARAIGLACVSRGEPIFSFVIRCLKGFQSKAMRSIKDSDPDLAVFLKLRMQEIFLRLKSQGWSDADIGVALDELIVRFERNREPEDMRLRLAM
jgi:hypothetical protein